MQSRAATDDARIDAALAVSRWILLVVRHAAEHGGAGQKAIAHRLFDAGLFATRETAEAQLSRYLEATRGGKVHVPRLDVMLTISQLVGADRNEASAMWEAASGKRSLEQQGRWSVETTKRAERSADRRLVLSEHTSFTIDHPDYSPMVHDLLAEGAQYDFVIPEDAPRAVALLAALAEQYRKARDAGRRFRAVVYLVKGFDWPLTVPEVAVYERGSGGTLEGIVSGHPLGPGSDRLLDPSGVKKHLDDLATIKRRAQRENSVGVWDAHTIDSVLSGRIHAPLGF